MSIFPAIAGKANALLDRLGENMTVRRSTASYDPATRKHSGNTSIAQVLKGTLETPRAGDRKLPESFTRTFERVAYVSPAPVSGAAFEPQVGDVLEHERHWKVAACHIERRQGVTILYTFGLDAA